MWWQREGAKRVIQVAATGVHSDTKSTGKGAKGEAMVEALGQPVREDPSFSLSLSVFSVHWLTIPHHNNTIVYPSVCHPAAKWITTDGPQQQQQQQLLNVLTTDLTHYTQSQSSVSECHRGLGK